MIAKDHNSDWEDMSDRGLSSEEETDPNARILPNGYPKDQEFASTLRKSVTRATEIVIIGMAWTLVIAMVTHQLRPLHPSHGEHANILQTVESLRQETKKVMSVLSQEIQTVANKPPDIVRPTEKSDVQHDTAKKANTYTDSADEYKSEGKERKSVSYDFDTSLLQDEISSVLDWVVKSIREEMSGKMQRTLAKELNSLRREIARNFRAKRKGFWAETYTPNVMAQMKEKRLDLKQLGDRVRSALNTVDPSTSSKLKGNRRHCRNWN